MLWCVRTTIRLPDELYGDVRRRSVQDGVTVTAFIEQAVRTALAHEDRSPVQRFEVKPFRGSGTYPGVDLTDSAALAELMEG
jgi:hypothetical protein